MRDPLFRLAPLAHWPVHFAGISSLATVRRVCVWQHRLPILTRGCVPTICAALSFAPIRSPRPAGLNASRLRASPGYSGAPWLTIRAARWRVTFKTRARAEYETPAS
jgi:hypothetical protein